MKHGVEKIGKITVIKISGNMFEDADCESLVETFDGLVEEGERTFVFDMTEVPKTLTAGMNAVVSCRNKLVRRDGTIKLAMKSDLKWVYATLFLDQLFEIHESREETLASFAA